MAEEDATRAYDAFKVARTPLARSRLADAESEVEQLKKEVEKLQQAGSSIGNNLIRTLLKEPRVKDNSWWRQLAKSVTIDTILKTLDVNFHNGKKVSMFVDPMKQYGKVINGADLWGDIKKELSKIQSKS
jgi:hypothetical protein